MNVNIKTFKQWMALASELMSEETIELALHQTYKEWLEEHPEGYKCCQGNHRFGEPCKT